MNIKNILFSKSHITAPFSMPDQAPFSTKEKVASIAIPLLLGLFSGGVGALAFYLITATIKAKKLNSQSEEKFPKIDNIVKKNLDAPQKNAIPQGSLGLDSNNNSKNSVELTMESSINEQSNVSLEVLDDSSTIASDSSSIADDSSDIADDASTISDDSSSIADDSSDIADDSSDIADDASTISDDSSTIADDSSDIADDSSDIADDSSDIADDASTISDDSSTIEDVNNPFADFDSQHFEWSPEYPASLKERRIPPTSLVDTVMFRSNDTFESIHPNDVKFYKDHEIVKLHPAAKEIYLDDYINAHITDNGKIVIQQQAMRGCTAAVAAMLIHDANKPLDLYSLQETNLGNTESMKLLITEAGLIPLVREFDFGNNTLSKLQEFIESHGSAIVYTGNDIGSHVVVVDEVSDQTDTVRLRDPYHGWAISVTKEAFLRGFSPGEIIQVEHPKAHL